MFHLYAKPRPPSLIGRDTPGHAVELFGESDRAGTALADDGVKMAQEAYRLKVLAAAVNIGDPLSLFTRVVTIQHRGDRIDAQAIHVEMLQPVEARCDQESLHFAAAEVIDVGIPVLMIALTGVLVLVKRRAVEACHAMRICREMRRHPIDDDADIRTMAGIDKPGKAVRRTKSRTGSEQAERLIAPRPAEWVLSHRHQLDMTEAHLADVGHQPRRQFIPCRNASVGMEPRCGVHLVDRNGRVGIMTARTLPHPRLVVPDLRCRIGNDGRCGRRQLGRTRQRVGFERQSPTVRARDGKLVARAVSEPWNEQLPDTSREAQTHRVSPRIPRVEITNDGDSARIRCPDGKPHTLNAIDCHDAGAKVRRQFKMPPFVEQVQIEVAKQRTEGIWIFGLLHRARPNDAQPIGL